MQREWHQYQYQYQFWPTGPTSSIHISFAVMDDTGEILDR